MSNPGPGLGIPPTDTGNRVLDWVGDRAWDLMHLERRFDPLIRPAFDALLRDRLSELVTGWINARRRPDGLGLAHERTQPGEEEDIQAIIDAFNAQMRRLWN